MKMLNKQARAYLLWYADYTAYDISVNGSYYDSTTRVKGYIGNHSKHMSGMPVAKHTVGKYLTARERNRL